MNVQSMTGYGEAEERGVKVEARSVNHRFLTINFRAPAFVNPYETELRKMIMERFTRGRFDVSISLTEEADLEIGINRRLAENILRTLKGLQEELGLKEGLSLDHLFWFRDSLFTEVPEYRPEDLFHTLGTALERLEETRLREGEHLLRDIQEQVAALKGYIDAVKAEAGDMHRRAFERIRSHITELIGEGAVEEQRVLQEAALLAEKADVSEEVVRIQSHLQQFERLISRGGTIGRNLDFLLQELLREINTIGSKSSEYRVSDIVVRMKTVVEKLKEQIQNIQ